MSPKRQTGQLDGLAARCLLEMSLHRAVPLVSFVSKSESGERRVDVIELLAFADVYRVPITDFLPRRSVRKTG